MINQNKSFSMQNGFKPLDETIEGPFYTGGPSSPVGLNLPTDSFYVQNQGVGGVVLWRKYGAGANDWIKAQPMDFYQSVSSVAETSTSSTTTNTTKLTLVTPSLPSGSYRLGWRYKWRAANAKRGIRSQIYDGATLLSESINFSANVADYPAQSSWIPLTGISGVKTYTFQFRVGIGATTIFVADAYFEFWRIA